MNKQKDKRRGAVLVEIALCFLIFIVLSIGLFEMARGVWIWTTLSHAVRQGSRFAMVRGADATYNSPTDVATITQVVRNQAIGLSPSDLTVNVTWETGAQAGGQFVEVQALYPFNFVTGYVLFGGPMNLGAKSRAVISY